MEGGCTHCGLPLGGYPVRGTVSGESGRFCCVGCLLAMQVTRARGDSGAAASLLVRLGVAVFFAMNVMMTSMSSYVPHVYGDSGAALDGPLFAVLRVLAACFALPVLAILGGPIVAAAAGTLRRGRASSDVLVLLAVIASYGLSLRNMLEGRSEIYFDTAVMLLIFVTAGRWLEAKARAEAGRAIRSVLAPRPSLARRVDVGGVSADVAVEDLLPDDVVEVAPGGAFPTDGVVVQGEAAVDESALSGESRPVLKRPGSAIAGGTCSIDGLLRVRVTARANDSAAARIEAMIDGARRERSAAERLADRVASALVPVVLVVALAAGAWWTYRSGIDRGVLVAVAVLVVACPCALGIATPVVVAAGLASAVRRGVVVRSAALLERAANAARVVFDKTGTLTESVPGLVEIRMAPGARTDVRTGFADHEGWNRQGVPSDVRTGFADHEAMKTLQASSSDERELLQLIATLERDVAHPLARAILAAASERGITPGVAQDVRLVAGRGVRGRVCGRSLFVGRADEGRLPRELGMPEESEGLVAIVLEDDRPLAALRFTERARDGAAEAVAELRALGVPVSVLSGDRSLAAIAPSIVPVDAVALGLAPEDKVARLRTWRATRRHADDALVMVGDGINDAPALAAADLGIAVAGATDLARLTADVVVLGGDLTLVPWLVAHARRVRRVARQNLAWAFGYNAVAVVLATAGALTPLLAALAMLTSSLAVVANARRLGGGGPHAAGVPEASVATTFEPVLPARV